MLSAKPGSCTNVLGGAVMLRPISPAYLDIESMIPIGGSDTKGTPGVVGVVKAPDVSTVGAPPAAAA